MLFRSISQRISRQPAFLRRMATSTGAPWKPQGNNKGPITWKTVAFTVAVGSVGLWYVNREKGEISERRSKHEAEMSNVSLGKPKVGGPFTLMDCETGKQVTEKDFLGKYMLIYFGFTHCPDICPDELEKMSNAISKLDLLNGVGENLAPVFISIDPGRDTPAVVTKYIKEFHPRFYGLTGTDEQVDQAAKAYRIYISKGDTKSGDDYLVDHSIFFFLMSPDGQLADYYGRNATSDEVVESIAKHIRQWKLDKQAGRI